jgi:hypothetical protein
MVAKVVSEFSQSLMLLPGRWSRKLANSYTSSYGLMISGDMLQRTESIANEVGRYQIQGHEPSATAEKHYKKRPIDLLRMWHVKIEKWILEQAGIEQPENVEENVNLKLVNDKQS